jgi:hypothetical protein
MSTPAYPEEIKKEAVAEDRDLEAPPKYDDGDTEVAVGTINALVAEGQASFSSDQRKLC